MNEAQALDLALPILIRAGLRPDALAALRARRLALGEILFAPTEAPDPPGYWLGHPTEPRLFITTRANAGAVLALHELATNGRLDTSIWAPDAREPVEAVRKRLKRALDDLYAVDRALVDALVPLDSADGQFIYRRRPGKPRIITAAAEMRREVETSPVAQLSLAQP